MNSTLRDLTLLVARIAVGFVFVAHGWQKFHDNGVDKTAAGFQKMGLPAPELAAYYATYVELFGGALLILGALTGLVGFLLVGDMLGALFAVHIHNGVFVNDGGYELVLVLAAVSLVFAVLGAGRYSVDNAISAKVGTAAGLSRL